MWEQHTVCSEQPSGHRFKTRATDQSRSASKKALKEHGGEGGNGERSGGEKINRADEAFWLTPQKGLCGYGSLI